MRIIKSAAAVALFAAALVGAAAGAAQAGPGAVASAARAARAVHGTSFTITFPTQRSAAALDGRIILLLSRDLTREPRTHVSPDEPLESPYIFGLNVDGHGRRPCRGRG